MSPILQKYDKKIAITLLVERKFDIDGYPNYFFGEDKKLYRFDSRGNVKQNKKVVIGTTQGYILKSRFYSLAQLRPLLRRHEPTDHPVSF